MRSVPVPPCLRAISALVLLPFATTTISAQSSAPTSGELTRTRATFPDYRNAAGRMVDGVWRVHLTAHEVAWHPRGENGPELVAYAFSADGGEPQVPAPMIRVSAGTAVEVNVTNGLERTLVLRGLGDRAEAIAAEVDTSGPPLSPAFYESLRLEPGETRTVRFTPTREGSFLYYARTLPVFGPIEEELFGGDGPDGSFIGPLIVDPPGASPPEGEQVMLITRWGDRALDPSSWEVSWKMMINGWSWPATERLHYTVGDTVTWRVINASLRFHPMHLHGFYFRVDARGDQMQDTTYAAAERRLAVTEVLGGLGESMRITWVPETPGNWLFHCHLVRHMSPMQRIMSEAPVGEHGHGMKSHAEDGMAGMIMGITVRPRPGEG